MEDLRGEIANTPSRLKAHTLGIDAKEMAPYQSEPKQMKSGAIGKSGYLKLRFKKGPHRSELVELERRVPLMVQKALYWDENMPDLPCVTMISTGGGTLQGDRQAHDFIVEEGACAYITTQSASKVQMMEDNYATQYQKIVVEAGGYLEYLPDPMTPHRDSRFITETEMIVDETATAIYSEILMPGRKFHHPDEVFGFDIFSSKIRAARPSSEESIGEELFVERYILEPKKHPLNLVAVMGDFEIFGNVILLTPEQYHQPIMERLKAVYDKEEQIAYGATLLPNKAGIIFKVLGVDTIKVKAVIREFWKISREEIKGKTIQDQFLWRV